jgi:hypothetical protein
MSELRSESGAPGGAARPRGPDAIGHDLHALASLSDRALPELETSLGAARRRATGEPRKGFAMALHFLRTRPALATALAVVVMAAALLVIPISYQRTVGFDVALTLAGDNVPETQVREIAGGFKETLGATGVTVTAAMESGRLTYVLKASAARDVRGNAAAFAQELNARGYAATITAAPRRETVSTSVYAYAMSQVIEISTDGKSAAQLGDEIRARLTAAGVTGASVSVTDVGNNGREVKIEARDLRHEAGAQPEIPELVLTKDGKPLAGGDMVGVMKKQDVSGATTLSLAVSSQGRSTTVEIPNADSMGDAVLAAEIQSRLLAAGFDMVVSVHGDEIKVEKRQK